LVLNDYEYYVFNLFNFCERFNKLPEDCGVENQRWDYLFIFSEMKNELNKKKEDK
jgi:hypothetical protein